MGVDCSLKEGLRNRNQVIGQGSGAHEGEEGYVSLDERVNREPTDSGFQWMDIFQWEVRFFGKSSSWH